ncbi:MAG TPA: thioredoxin family protein [Gelidibacter sp.]|uniref:thioredoxin family protein n=1 Tax=Gelidibacter sp. TaxID=2018083 RepID=UPI002BB8706C|nr:thioredoxin family protein [Gelidibacter sp.]HXJ99387.1 thioredoxin family protein [Gelidibacter sp.]
MANTPSNMLPLGTTAPDFNLADTVSGDPFNLSKCKGIKATVVMFISNHCPFVKHVNPTLAKLAKTYKSKGIEFVAIGSNAVEDYPQDGPEFMKQLAIEHGFIFPYLYDQTQAVAKAYDAACTPDFYVFDDQLKLVYRGQLDSSRPGNGIPVTGVDLINALDAILNNKPISKDQKPSLGCNIKWRTEH